MVALYKAPTLQHPCLRAGEARLVLLRCIAYDEQDGILATGEKQEEKN